MEHSITLDPEWIRLIVQAKQQGLHKDDIREFLHKWSTQTNEKKEV